MIDREAYNAYQRNWRAENREKYLSYEAKRYQKRQYYRKEYYDKTKDEVKKVLGEKCVICKSTNHIHYHEIHGKDHCRNWSYVIEHPEDFIVLCSQHHVALHALANNKGNIKKFLRLLFFLIESKETI